MMEPFVKCEDLLVKLIKLFVVVLLYLLIGLFHLPEKLSCPRHYYGYVSIYVDVE